MQLDILDKPAQLPRVLCQYDELPGPCGIPVLGNALQIKAPRFHQQLEHWCREYRPFFKLRIGNRRLLIVGDYQVVAAVLRDRPYGLRRTSRFEEICVEMGLPLGVFAANGDAWKRQRRMVMAGFDPAHVNRYFPALQAVSQRLVDRWRLAAKEGLMIDLQADLMR